MVNRNKEMLLAAVDVAYSTTDYLDGLTMAAHASKQIDWLTRNLVAHARSEGASWTDIGVALGISRQAAQQRFGH